MVSRLVRWLIGMKGWPDDKSDCGGEFDPDQSMVICETAAPNFHQFTWLMLVNKSRAHAVRSDLIHRKGENTPRCIYGLADLLLMDSQAIFDVMADPTRRRILGLLVMEGELCVCEMTAALDDIQPKVSRHLSVIREAGLVRARREGTWMFYRIEHDLPEWQRDMLDAIRDGAVPELSADRARLRRMSGRPARVNSRSPRVQP